eukprot:scaffold22604_cov130-Cylindrotheca_fusiformis.AAC.8
MVSASLQERMAAFESKAGSSKAVAGVNSPRPRSPNLDADVARPRSPPQSSRVDASGSVSRHSDAGDEENPVEESDNGADARVHTSVKHPWSERKNHRIDEGSKQVSMSDDETELEHRPMGGRPMLKDKAYESISRRRLEVTEAAKKPVSRKHRTMQILKCAGMTLFVAAFIIATTITIVTGWGDGSVETVITLQGVVPGKIVALSGNGEVAVVGDDFGLYQVYVFNKNESPMWTPLGPTFRSRGRVNLSEDGSTIAFVDTSQRLRFTEYDKVQRRWIQQDAPILTGDDLAINPEFNLLTIGNYGLGSITDFNSKVGEGSITTYKYNGEDWTQHGSALVKLFGLQSFRVSPDGTGMVTVSDNDGNITLNGYKSFDEGNEAYAWAKSDVTISLATNDIDVAVSNQIYAVASDNHVQAFSYSGRPWGQEIVAAADTNITSVALSSSGRILAIGSFSEDKAGFVDWYEFPKGQGSSGSWVSMGETLRADGTSETLMFGSALDLNMDASQLAVQSGLEGRESVHFYDVTFKARRLV